MSALIHLEPNEDAAERHRRGMLAESDQLLDQVEELRLMGRRVVPVELADAIRALQIRLGRADAARPRSVRAAHHLVFAVQARLMAANPRSPQPRSHVGRPTGAPTVTLLRRGAAWKFLTLPPRPLGSEPGAGDEWRLQVRLTVERAFDRWASAQNQAVAAAREGQGAVPAVSRARAAWDNYWELCCEAGALLSGGRSAADPKDAPLPFGLVSSGAADAAADGGRPGVAARTVVAATRPIESSRCSRW